MTIRFTVESRCQRIDPERFVCLVALISLFAAALSARPVAAGEITGIIQDQVSGAVPGATVTVTNIATNQQRIVMSTGDGRLHRREPAAGQTVLT
jgi:hypothetical protein